jgi:hypothetical protein
LDKEEKIRLEVTRLEEKYCEQWTDWKAPMKPSLEDPINDWETKEARKIWGYK